MSGAHLLGYLFVATCVVSAVYAALSRDFLRASIAFFIELSSLAGVLLTLNADYLALLVFSAGLVGTMLVISFSSVIMGSLKDSFKRHTESTRQTVAGRVLGMALGLGVGAAIGWALLTAPFLDVAKDVVVATEPDVPQLGRMMLGEQIAVFELIGVMFLVVVVGAGLLLRRSKHAD